MHASQSQETFSPQLPFDSTCMNNNGKYVQCLAIFNTFNIREQIILKNKQGMKLYEQQLNGNTMIIRAAHNTVLIQKKIEARNIPKEFCTRNILVWVSRYAATTFIVALSSVIVI